MIRQISPSRNRSIACFFSCFIFLGVFSYLYSQTPVISPVPAALSFGGDLRLRNEYVNNGVTLNDSAALHEQDYFRTRLRLWANEQLAPSTNVFLRLAAEPRNWVKDAYVKTHTGTGSEWRFAIIDALYAKWTGKIEDNPISLTVGRQDIQIGDTGNCWLIMEGTPSDGSWTWFFDAARMNFDYKSAKTKIDLIVLNQRASVDARLPIIGSDAGYLLTDQNENGFIAYVSNYAIPTLQVDGYFIYKRNRAISSTGIDSDTYTLGSKIGGKFSSGWSYALEGATQWGTKADPLVRYPVKHPESRDISAYGGVARLNYAFNDAHKNLLGFAAEFLSGDKPGTGDKDEMFDTLWGRYPRYSEVYGFSYSAETGRNSMISNLVRFGTEWSFVPVKGITIGAKYQLLMSDQAVSTRVSTASLFSALGRKRGDLYQLKITRQFSKDLSGYLLGEFIEQGSYYARRDLLTFIRCELAYTF
jgi:hypothetical protein